MRTTSVPTRTALSGTTVLMACACGASSSAAKLLALAGLGLGAAIIHPAIIGIGAVLVLSGLWRQSRRTAVLGAAAFVVMAVAALLLPQHVMASGDMGQTTVPWGPRAMSGAALFIVSIAMLAYAFWRAYPSARPSASASAIGGMALATGCTCCMVTGATAGMVMTLGIAVPLQREPILFWVAMAFVAVGMYRLAGVRALPWVAAGALLVRLGLDWINQIFGEPRIHGINPMFVPKYAIMLAGYGVLMYAFAFAYRVAGERVQAATLVVDRVPTLEGAD